MSEKKMNKNIKVIVDDNYHYMDESARTSAGSYASLEEALVKCKEITVRSLEDLCEEGITPEKLHAQWLLFGDDPFIRGSDERVPFSARKFITIELCKSIIDLKKNP